LKVNLQLISKRAQNLLEQKEFFKEDIGSLFFVEWENDKILTVSHRGNPADAEFIFAESLARIAKKRSIPELWKISFREVDSFLRDENHLPAFSGEADVFEEVFNQIKISLIAYAAKSKLSNPISYNENLTLAKKNEWAQNLLRPLGWQLVLLEAGVLTVTHTPENVQAFTLEAVINTILEGEVQIPPLKVVAV
jgi:hypothetical protein